MAYVEGFILAVPAANKDAYRRHASEAAPMFRDLGAVRMVETWADDVPDGKLTDFKRAVKARDDEEVVFSWLEYPDKRTRDAANEKIMSDPRMTNMDDMPFDGMRMVFGGFELICDVGPGGEVGYVDGTVVAVPADGRDGYERWAREIAALFLEYGATRVVDGWGDDVPAGKVTDYQGAVKANPDEKVAVGWVEWPSKAVRQEGWQKMESDPRMQDIKTPFDGQRMIFGGFSPILDVH